MLTLKLKIMVRKTVQLAMFAFGMIAFASCSNNEELVVESTTQNSTGSSSNSSSNNSGTSSSSALETYLINNADYVHNINGFYIVGSAQTPSSNETTPGITGKDVFDHSVRLFSSFLDQDNDGKVDDDKVALNQQLAQKTLFVSGYLAMVDKISFANQVEGKGLYAMSMQTDNWPYVKDYNGKGWTIDKLNSSTWRPQAFNALWEEVFHTITEAISRSDNEFAFTSGKKLRQFMEDDISAGTYDISVQNAEENGNYDKVTAVNEYIHQIWAINFAGQASKLNSHQKKALDFMIAKNVPMNVNASYSMKIGNSVK